MQASPDRASADEAHKGITVWQVWYIIMFSGLAILLIAVVLIRNSRTETSRSSLEAPTGTPGPSHTRRDSAARQERKRRRTQSKNDRRKRR